MNKRAFVTGLGIAYLVGLLLFGIPLFIRSPLWVDATYHDVSAWNILHGGVHYRDVFETNFPGMVWVHAIFRSIFGYSHEALRIADLLVLATIAAFGMILIRQVGAKTHHLVGIASALVLFYLFETEFIHAQRDGWMLLPVLGALVVRWRAITRANDPAARLIGRLAVAQGMLLGLAVWIKPHVMVPALFMWLGTMRYFPGRSKRIDLLGLLFGGIIVGALGILYLKLTGTWAPMLEVLLHWNQGYYNWERSYIFQKIRYLPTYFEPFSTVHYLGLPLAIWSMMRRSEYPVRSLLGAVYLGWTLQATIIQKEFDYAHAPAVLLLILFLGTYRLPQGSVYSVWIGISILVYQLATPAFHEFERKNEALTHRLFSRHQLLNPRYRHWGRCWTESSPELKDALAFHRDTHCATNYTDLKGVEDYLRNQGVGDGDVLAWYDTTHSLYLSLNIRPGGRFPHAITAMRVEGNLREIQRETLATTARFAVSDLAILEPSLWWYEETPRPGPAERLPAYFPQWQHDVFPWNQPVVYRSGRYIVHRIDQPRGIIKMPWYGWAVND